MGGLSTLGAVWSRLWGGAGGLTHTPQQHRQQRGSFNQRQEQRTHTWRQRLTHTPFRQWVEAHASHPEGLDATLDRPPAVEEYDPHTWYQVVGGALSEVRSSPFCEPGLLGLLNQAQAESSRGQEVKGDRVTEGQRQQVPLCFSCVSTSPHAVLAEVCSRHDVTSCLVLGEQAWWGVSSSPGGVASPMSGLEFCSDPCPAPWPKLRPLLHDGDSAYQRDLLRSLLAVLPRLPAGGALVFPLRSVLTRVTAAVVLALHLCFGSLAFRCPRPGPPVVLVCVGFVPPLPPGLLPALEEALEEMRRLEGKGTQVLQIAPVEDLFRGGLPHFLCALNAAVARQRLHLLLQQDQTS